MSLFKRLGLDSKSFFYGEMFGVGAMVLFVFLLKFVFV